MNGNHQFVIMYVDGGVIGPNDHRSRGVYWSLYVAENKDIVRKQERDHYRTNNDAEWLALREALQYAREHYLGRPVVIYSDSKLIVRQFNGEFRVKIARHHRLKTECLELARSFSFLAVKMPERPSLEQVRELLIREGVPEPTATQCRDRQAAWRPREVMVEKLGH